MNAKQWFLYLSLLAILISVLFWSSDSLSPSGASGSPLPTPPLPSPTPVPVSKCHALAIAHVAREHSIPQGQLLAGSCFLNADKRWVCDGREEWFEFPLIQRKACAVRVWVKDRDKSYSVAVSEQGQITNLAALRAQERAAGVAKCGKLDPMLCARWSALADGEEVEVAFWLASPDIMATYDTVAAGYPPSLQPVPGAAFDIGHPDYEKALLEVEEQMQKVYLEKAEPVMSSLKAMGARNVGTITTAPMVFATLSKQAVSNISARDDISTIYLLEGQFGDAMDSVAGTIRVSPFWTAGDTGSGIRVAVVEDDPIDFSNDYLDHADGGTGPDEYELNQYPDLWEHATAVAGVIAMKGHSIYQGVAPDVTLYSADAGSYAPPGGERRVITATNWALNAPNYADVVNCSFGGDAGQYGLLARYYDYVVRWLRRTVVSAAGNTGQYVESPGTAYNVISVGGFDDKNTAGWSDDEMWGSSSYDGPGAREKPEVVAVSNHITTTSHSALDGYRQTITPGTSYAAPQVSGLAALLMQETGLDRQPELIKAVIMASAAHNVEGTTPVNDRDGVGGIDAAMAKAVVDHGRYGVAPDGWYDYRTVYGFSFDGDYLHYSVSLSRGQKIRIALVWNSHPVVSDPWNTDELDSDLDLYVYRGASQEAASTFTADNFEFVEYTATATGTYDVRVKKQSWHSDYEYIGLAWAKMATYLPDIKSSYDNWESEIIVRNDGAQNRDATVTLFDGNGGHVGSATIYGLQSSSVWVYNPPHAGFSGSAIVDGSEDVSVVVHNYHSPDGQAYSYNGVALQDPLHLGWEQVGTDIHVPLLHNNNYGWYTQLALLNTSSHAATVTVNYYDQLGGGPYVHIRNWTLQPNEVLFLDQSGSTCPTVCGGHVTSSRPLAVTVRQYKVGGNGVSAGYNGFSSGTTTLNLPLIMANNYGWFTSIVVQNLGSSQTTATITYYPAAGYQGRLPEQFDLQPHSIFIRPQTGQGWPVPWVGSARVTATAGQPIAAVVNEQDADSLMTYSGFSDGSTWSVLPDVFKGYGGWNSGVQVQNLDSALASVELWLPGDTSPFWSGSIGAYKSATVDLASLPSGFRGPATVRSTNDKRLVTIVNRLITGTDRASTYDGITR